MTKRPWTDAEFEVIRGPKPRRWEPLAGLSPFERLVAVAITMGALAGLRWLIAPPIARFVDWLFAASGHR